MSNEKLITEMVVFHRSLNELLANENEKFAHLQEHVDLEAVTEKLSAYHTKLRSLQKEMGNIRAKSKQLAGRARKLSAMRQDEDERVANELENMKRLEQSLKPVKPPSSSATSTLTSNK